MAVSKVVFGERTVIDLTEDTVSSDNLLSGATAHGASGEKIEGAVSFISVYTGSQPPSDDVGNDGDIYFLIREDV